ncbi:MAG: hypothetical protein WC264_00745 [Candidatus Paceibacterota bacterium]|jgi:hypothetical protein
MEKIVATNFSENEMVKKIKDLFIKIKQDYKYENLIKNLEEYWVKPNTLVIKYVNNKKNQVFIKFVITNHKILFKSHSETEIIVFDIIIENLIQKTLVPISA